MPATPWDFAAAITAGGRSSRFGSDKALALLHGRALLQHVAASLEPCPERLLVVPPGRYTLQGWKPVADTRPGEGPLAGLEAALRAAPDGWVAFTGVDLPGLTRDYWITLAQARLPGTLSVQALDATGRSQPLGALYHTELLPRIHALLDSGERRLRLAAPQDATVTVAGVDPAALRNVNTPADLETLAHILNPRQ